MPEAFAGEHFLRIVLLDEWATEMSFLASHLNRRRPHQVRADAVSAAVHARRRGGPRAWARLHAADAEQLDG